jgi:hypothetical protein
VYDETGRLRLSAPSVKGDQVQELQPERIANAKADDAEFVEFVQAGERVTGAYECVACAHRVFVRGKLEPCQGCRGTLWERSTWTPFANALSGLARVRR